MLLYEIMRKKYAGRKNVYMADDWKSDFTIPVDENVNRNEKYHSPVVKVQALRKVGSICRPVVPAAERV